MTRIVGYVFGIFCVFLTLQTASTSAVTIEYRNINGSGNNLDNPGWGATGSTMLRQTTHSYVGDGSTMPTDLPSPRNVSNQLAKYITESGDSRLNPRNFNEWLSYFGQFIAHDVTLDHGNSSEFMPVPVPCCDEYFDPTCGCSAIIPFKRSTHVAGSGTSSGNPRDIINHQTSFLDLSVVYGETDERAAALRTGSGGKLKTSGDGTLLPTATQIPSVEMENANCVPDQELFVSGDMRANAVPPLTVLHTVFHLEHNRLCDVLADTHGSWDDERLYQEARRLNIAGFQAIVLNEYYVAITGERLEDDYAYDDTVDPSVSSFFATVGFRYGHSELSGPIPRLSDVDGSETSLGSIQLRDAFFEPEYVRESGLEPFIYGLASQHQHAVDGLVVDDMRNFLLGLPGACGVDIFSLDIQRARDHGLPSGHVCATDLDGTFSYDEWSDITDDAGLASVLAGLYGSPTKVDPIVVALIEEKTYGNLGPLFMVGFKDQFVRWRTGDRLWFENPDYFTADERESIAKTRLAKIFERNTNVNVQDGVFRMPGEGVVPEADPSIDNFQPSDYPASGKVLGGDMTLRWVFGENYIQIAMSVKTTGWIGIGFGGDENSMVGADIYIGSVSKGSVAVGDYYAFELGTPSLDSANGGTDSVLAYGGSEEDGETTIVFRRPLKADDGGVDNSIDKGKNDVIVAYGESDALNQHAQANREYVVIDFYEGTIEEGPADPTDALRITHAVLMAIVWMMWLPAGVFLLRFSNVAPRVVRRKMHMGIQVSGVFLTVLAIVLIFIAMKAFVVSAHSIVGIGLITPLMFAQATIYFWPCVDYMLRIKIHKYIGPLLLILSQIQCFMGLLRMAASPGVIAFFALYETVLFILFYYFERQNWEYKGRGTVAPEMKSSVDDFSSHNAKYLESQKAAKGRTNSNGSVGGLAPGQGSRSGGNSPKSGHMSPTGTKAKPAFVGPPRTRAESECAVAGSRPPSTLPAVMSDSSTNMGTPMPAVDSESSKSTPTSGSSQ